MKVAETLNYMTLTKTALFNVDHLLCLIRPVLVLVLIQDTVASLLIYSPVLQVKGRRLKTKALRKVVKET